MLYTAGVHINLHIYLYDLQFQAQIVKSLHNLFSSNVYKQDTKNSCPRGTRWSKYHIFSRCQVSDWEICHLHDTHSSGL